MLENIKLIQVQVNLHLHFQNHKGSDQPVKYCNFFVLLRCDSFYNIPSTMGQSQKPGIGLGKKV